MLFSDQDHIKCESETNLSEQRVGKEKRNTKALVFIFKRLNDLKSVVVEDCIHFQQNFVLESDLFDFPSVLGCSVPTTDSKITLIS